MRPLIRRGWVLGLLIVLAACLRMGTAPVSTPSTMHVHVHVRDADHPGTGLVGATVRLHVARNPDVWVEATSSGADGYAMLTVPSSLIDTQLEIAPPAGYDAYSEHQVVSADLTIIALVKPTFVPLPRLVVDGQFFKLATGERWTAIEASDFNLFARYQAGEDITPILRERAGLGFNLVRVWTLFRIDKIGTLTAPDYAKIPAFLDLCAKHGLRVEATAYTSIEDTTHWTKLAAAVAGKTNVMLELVNEEDQAANHLAHLAEYARPSGVLASHGSNGSQNIPVQPFWDYATFHTNAASEEQRGLVLERKIGHNAWEIWDGPTLTNETSRFPEVGMWRGASTERIAQLAYDSAAGAALLAAGSCFHSVHGKTSEPFDAAELAAATAWVAGARSVDLACQAGPYRHRKDLEEKDPDALRIYERPVAGHNCLVRIRKAK